MNGSDGFYLASYVEQESSRLLKWVAYHRVRGAGKIKVWLSPRNFKDQTLVHALAKNGVLSVEVLRLDAGTPLKSLALLMAIEVENDAGMPCLALADNEYFCLGGNDQSFVDALGAMGADITAVTMPVQVFSEGLVPEPDIEFRTLFQPGIFGGHNGERPTAPKADVNVNWVNGDGIPIDPSVEFWFGREDNAASLYATIFRDDKTQNDNWIQDWEKRTRAEISLLVEIPEIKAAYNALVKAETDAPALADLKSENPEETTEAAPTVVSADRFAQVLTDPPPPWFVEIYPGGEQKGFMRRLQHHSLIMLDRGAETLVVTFDNLSNVNDLSFGRVPWGYKFLKEQGHSQLGVMARRKDWYREPGLIAALQELAADGLFERFKNVVFAGTSMGGFAAMAFSSLASGATVLALSPQSTLDEAIVPWESRFGMGRLRNWKLPHGDAAFEIDDAKVFIISDPYHPLDQKHIDRLQGENVTKLKAWYSGHFSPVFLRRAELLKPVFAQAIEGMLSEASFYELYRGRRKLPWYRKSLEESLHAKGHHKLADRVGPAFVTANIQHRSENV